MKFTFNNLQNYDVIHTIIEILNCYKEMKIMQRVLESKNWEAENTNEMQFEENYQQRYAREKTILKIF